MYTSSAIAAARRKTLWILAAIDLLLIVVTMANGHPNIWSDFDKEKNAWTFGNSLNMILVSVVAYVNYLILAKGTDRRKAKSAWIWAFLAFAFLFLSADDFLILHERAGHAIERAAPSVSRHHIVIYADDMIELGYTVAAALFGLVFLRRLVDKGSLKLFLGGTLVMLVATGIGLDPAMKTQPFPMALIQILQLLSVFLFFVSFLNWTSNELSSSSSPSVRGRTSETPSRSGRGG